MSPELGFGSLSCVWVPEVLLDFIEVILWPFEVAF